MEKKNYEINLNGVLFSIILYPSCFALQNQTEGFELLSKIKQLHSHAFFELFLIFDGALSIVGRERANQTSDLAVLVPPSYDHYTVFDVVNGYVLYFHLQPSKDADPGAYNSIYEKIAPGVCSVEQTEEELYYVERLYENLRTNGSDTKNRLLLALLFQSIFFPNHALLDEKEEEPSRHKKYVFEIDEYIQKHRFASVTLKDLSRALYLCPKQISRIIKAEYGCSLSTLLNQRRMSMACMLLAKTDMRISEIAKMVGFEYESYFYAVFKKEFGISPAQYRLENK